MEELFSTKGWRITRETARLPDEREKTMVRVYRCDSVHIIAQPTPTTVLLLREYRPFYGTWLWMLPSGKVDKETDIAAAAQRELREETGLRATVLEHFVTCHCTESMVYAQHVFTANDLHPDPLPQDAAEMIEVKELPLAEAIDKVLRSPYVHTVSAMALLAFARKRRV